MDFEDKYEIADLRRRLSNLLRIGTISAVNYKEAVARVKIGDLETTWLPWLLRDGDDKVWHGVDLNEQVLVLSPCGDLNQGLILSSVYKEPISDDGNLLLWRFKDGSIISFNRSSGELNAQITGNAAIVSQKSITAEAKVSAVIKSPKIILDGDVEITKSLTIAQNLTTSGTVSLSGGTPVARVGDAVSIDANTHQGTILAGSAKVKAG